VLFIALISTEKESREEERFHGGDFSSSWEKDGNGSRHYLPEKGEHRMGGTN